MRRSTVSVAAAVLLAGCRAPVVPGIASSATAARANGGSPSCPRAWERTYRYLLGSRPVGAARVRRDGDAWLGEDDLSSVGLRLETRTVLDAAGAPLVVEETGAYFGKPARVRLAASGGRLSGELTDGDATVPMSLPLPAPGVVLETDVLAHWAIAAARCPAPPCAFAAAIPSVQLSTTLTLEDDGALPDGGRRLRARLGPLGARLEVDAEHRLTGADFEGVGLRVVAGVGPHARPVPGRDSPLLAPGSWKDTLVDAGGAKAILCEPAPAHGGLRPAAILLGDYGALDPDGTVGKVAPLADLAHAIAASGGVSIRLGKPEAPASVEAEYVAPARAALGLLSARADVDAAHVTVVGHGLGALAALLVAKADPRVAGVVLLAPSSEPPVAALPRIAHYLALRRGATQSNADAEADARAKALTALAGPLDGRSAEWWRSRLALDPLSLASEARAPALVVWGDADYLAPPAFAEAFAAALPAAAGVETLALPRVDHELIAIEGESDGEEYLESAHVAARLLERVARDVAGAK